MEFISIREFNASQKSAREKLKRDGKFVLTSHGQPMALVISLTSENFEETLETARQIESLKLIKAMRAEAADRGFLTDEEIQLEINAARSEAAGRKRES